MTEPMKAVEVIAASRKKIEAKTGIKTTNKALSAALYTATGVLISPSYISVMIYKNYRMQPRYRTAFSEFLGVDESLIAPRYTAQEENVARKAALKAKEQQQQELNTLIFAFLTRPTPEMTERRPR